ncbi:MAG: M20/M25/M40 family metallo-hydrolase [Acholeplasmatales bacterium]|nr:M20/M25/M40 family metallo-hydrolase [Acholeplasmatales bacterium]
MINKERIINEFNKLISFDSLSFHEKNIYEYLINKLKSLGLKIIVDDAGKKLSNNNDSGNNIYAILEGNKKGEPILFSSHMDTVSPGINKKAIIDGDIIKSSGDTILGADDVTGIVSILEALNIIIENNLSHPDIEVVFFVAEEPYCKGSSVFDFNIIKSKIAYVLDLQGSVGTAAISAPSIFSFEIDVLGKAAHAGFEIEKGISSILISSEAISKIKFGRLDENTTLNIGTINGGDGKNIVPEKTIIKGELRSNNRIYALDILNNIKNVFDEVSKKYNGISKFNYIEDIMGYKIDKNSYVVKRYQNALDSLGYGKAILVDTFGGSDNNNFNKNGILGIVITNAMNNIHTKNEYFKISELIKSINITLKLMTMED